MGLEMSLLNMQTSGISRSHCYSYKFLVVEIQLSLSVRSKYITICQRHIQMMHMDMYNPL